jgi:uncharacterized membrane protein (UPF0127 family)
LVAGLVLLFAGAAGATHRFPLGTAAIDTDERRVTVLVELATTARQRSLGLMHRRALPANAGMVFLYPRATRGAFWMKNTLIPLSIAFWDARGRIVRILDMTPCRSDPCPLYDPGVAYVGALEVNRGAFRRWGVERGDRIAVRRR